MLKAFDLLITEARWAARSLARSKRLLFAGSAALALGLGVNVTVFSFADRLLLRPLPYERPEELVSLGNDWQGVGAVHAGMSMPEAMDHRTLDAWESVAVTQLSSLNFTSGSGRPETVTVANVTDNLFHTLGASLQRGRPFAATEGTTEGPRVAILSHGLWQRRFGGADVIGDSIVVEGERHEIVGVMGRDYDYPQRSVDVWLPFRFGPDVTFPRGYRGYRTIARLAPGVSLDEARTQADTLATRVQEDNPEHYLADWGFGFSVRGLHDHAARSTRPALLLLLGAAAAIALIACSNVANLFLCQLVARSRALAMRRALGASKLRASLPPLLEALGVAIVAGALGALLAGASQRWLAGKLPEEFVPDDGSALFDARIFGFTVVLSLLAALLVSAITLPKALSISALGALRSREGSDRSPRVRAALVVGQTALAVALVMTTFLLARSLREMTRVDPGFEAGQTISAGIALDPGRYVDDDAVGRFWASLQNELDASAAVDSAGLVSLLPLVGTNDWSIIVEGSPTTSTDEVHFPQYRAANSGYFETLGIPLLEGRHFGAQDLDAAPAVAIVNQTFAERFFPSKSAIGQRIKTGGISSPAPWLTIVGVVGDVHELSLDQAPQIMFYRPVSQAPETDLSVVVAARGGESLEPLTAALEAVDPEQSLYDVMPLQTLLAESSATEKTLAALLSLFSFLAMALAALGIYGVLTFVVEQERPALGVRLALGAQARDIVRLVLSRGAALAGVGLGLGAVLFLAARRTLTSFLYGVGTLDPAAVVLTVATLTAVLLLACWLPARRALETDPLRVLRSD